jgi:uncharacterized membrane protein
MNEKKFSIEEAIEFAFEKTKKYFWSLVLIGLTICVINGISGSLDSLDKKYKGIESVTIPSFLLQMIILIVGFLLSLGIAHISLKIARNEEFKYTDIFSQVKFLWKYILSSIVYGLIVIGGLILLIVPGVIWSIKFHFYPYFILQGKGPIEALKQSAKITYGSKWRLFFLNLSFGVVVVLGFLCLFIGLLWTIPVTWIASALVFDKLSKNLVIEEPNILEDKV